MLTDKFNKHKIADSNTGLDKNENEENGSKLKNVVDSKNNTQELRTKSEMINRTNICLGEIGKLIKSLYSSIRAGMGLMDCINQASKIKNWMINGPLMNCDWIKSVLSRLAFSGKYQTQSQNSNAKKASKKTIPKRLVNFDKF